MSKMFKSNQVPKEEEKLKLIDGITFSGSSDPEWQTSSNVKTVDEVVNVLDWGPFHWLLLIQCGLSWACDATEMMLLSFLVPKITPVMLPDASKDTRKTYGFLLGAVTFSGIWLGSLLFGRVSDKYGRKKGYLISTMVVGLFGLLCSFSTSIYMLIALRGCVGIGLGGVTCAVTLFSELVPEKYRGSSIILSIGALWTFGCLFETCLAWFCFTLPGTQWQLFLVLSAVPSLSLLTMFPWLVESPRYYMISNQEEKALEVLKHAAKKNKVKLPQNLKLKTVGNNTNKNQQGQGHSHLKTLFSKKLRLTTFLLFGLWFCSVISYYGLSFVTPLYFSYQNHNEYVVTLLAALAEIPGMVTTSYLVDKIGRKKTKMVMFTIGGFSTLVLSMNSLPFVVLSIAAVVARGSVLGAFNDLYVYTPEVYPTTSRAFGLGLCSSVARIAGIIVSYISFSSESASEASEAVFVYSMAAFVGAILSFCLPYETKGAALNDDDQDESSSNSDSNLQA
jgi:MFS family permease